MTRPALLVALAVLTATGAARADLTRVERRIAKEPAYSSKSPRYALLVIGPEARDRVWLVKDGDTLYADLTGDGDLTGAGKKLTAKKGSSAGDGYSFEADTLTAGGKTHYRLNVMVAPLKRWMILEYAKRPDMLAAFKADPAADVLIVSLDAALPHLKPKGSVTVLAGPIDLNGPLVLAKKPAEAPIIHLGGPLQVTFYAGLPTLRRNRSTECITVVGTPGLGRGTFAMFGYEQTIPAGVRPVADIVFPPARKDLPPVKKRFEFKQRC
jgi:hypothetical protein